ncbi:hypothetical protein C8J56DRAFT_195860 [Mycena floridula]|nr:hypothetical protein C8J56DRAFT_195860 [Mycena floridula]
MGRAKIGHKRRKLSSSESSPSYSLPSPEPVNHDSVKASCGSCHRASPTASLIFCQKCSSPTCSICSRTCTTNRPNSSSPRRLALSLNSANTNSTMTSIPAATGKRKKDTEEDDKEKVEVAEETGCGRILCRSCCFEHIPTATTTCYDCFRH